MIYVNFDNNHNSTLDELYDVFSKLKDYAAKKKLENVSVLSVENCTWQDKENQRYDIEISYTDKSNKLFSKKLLILKGEVIDGVEFHRRYEEFYPDRKR